MDVPCWPGNRSVRAVWVQDETIAAYARPGRRGGVGVGAPPARRYRTDSAQPLYPWAAGSWLERGTNHRAGFRAADLRCAVPAVDANRAVRATACGPPRAVA